MKVVKTALAGDASMTRLLLAAAAAITLLAGSAVAQPPARTAGDVNGDGRVTLAEMQARVREHFGRMDLNRDGRLTRDEARQAHERMRADRVAARFGADGVMSRDEFRERADERFARMDADRDGRLTPEEMRGGRRGGMGARGLAGLRGRHGGMGSARLGAMMGLDGEVTLAELEGRLAERFERLDTNNDGALTREDRRGRMGRGAPRTRRG